VIVHPGDTVNFKNSWSGEPHSVTMGGIVDDLFEIAPKIEQYDSRAAAVAAGIDEALLARADRVFAHLPGMTDSKGKVYQPGAKPCFVADIADVPIYQPDPDSENVERGPKANCPTAGQPQPAFTGKQSLYNSGFIPFEGQQANTFTIKIAENATPGTYNYFCNYHWTDMHGTVKVVPKSKAIPSSATVNRQAHAQIDKLAKPFLAEVAQAKAGHFGKLTPPVAGLPTPKGAAGSVSVDEFLPAKIHAQVDKPVTWTVSDLHTISFNVPKYFPVYALGKNGDVALDARTEKAVGWKVPAIDDSVPDGPTPPRVINVGVWDGTGGFHSSGFLNDGDTFSLTFSHAGTYPYACVIHPPMIGEVVVSA
jgi:plastocyanin